MAECGLPVSATAPITLPSCPSTQPRRFASVPPSLIERSQPHGIVLPRFPSP